MRICSLFSSGTELVYALGLGDAIVGRTEHCQYPTAVQQQPIVVRSRIASAALSSRGIHEAVEDMCAKKEHHYIIDVPLLETLSPDVLITQDLCNVCAAGHPEIDEAIAQLSKKPRIVSVRARRWEELFTDIETVGKSLGCATQAADVSAQLRQVAADIAMKLDAVQERPRVWCAEWLDPLMYGGHWVPDVVRIAGGIDRFGTAGGDSGIVTWEDVAAHDPEVIVVMPCSFSLERTAKEFSLLQQLPGWDALSAVQAGRVYAVDGSYFHHPGPRLMTGLTLMASMCHPTLFDTPSTTQVQPLR
jgi:iron complex transport system substrate-binding protein